jgi:hypothetical protein
MLFSADPTLVERVITFLKDEDWNTAVSTLGGIGGLISLVVGVPIVWVKAAAARRSAAGAKEDREKADKARDAALKAAENAADAQKRIAAAMERLAPGNWELAEIEPHVYSLRNLSGSDVFDIEVSWQHQRGGPVRFGRVTKGSSQRVGIQLPNRGPREVTITWAEQFDGERFGPQMIALP